MDFNDFVFVVVLFRGGDGEFPIYFFCLSAVHSVFELGGYDGDVVGIDQAVAVDVAVAYVSFEVAVALAQSGVVHVGGEVVVVDLTVVVDVARQVAFGARYFEDVEFAS